MPFSNDELLSQLMVENQELKELVEQHSAYESQLEEMNHRPYLSPEEDLERKKIQKAKLAGKDQIERILASHNAA